MKLLHAIFIVPCSVFIFSCSVSNKISKQATDILLKDSAISQGHIGISIYEPAANSYWYNYDATKYFLPSSNVKLFTLYAGMKYLGDSLVGLRYKESKDTITIYPNADPTFLHPDFVKQPVFDLLARKKYFYFCSQYFTDNLGKGWAWDDYREEYMAQRSEFPLYGNLISIYASSSGYRTIPGGIHLDLDKDLENYDDNKGFNAYRDWNENKLFLTSNFMRNGKKNPVKTPIVAGLYDMPRFLMDTLHNNMSFSNTGNFKNNDPRLSVIHSQPSDSLFKPMMHNSDNFFAEQTLLMASNEHLGYMSDEALIDSLLKTDLKDVPQMPKWVDGSGLSRYNLFTPQSFIYILSKLKNEFGWDRLKNILPTGGQGTLKSWYLNDSGYVYAKTGTHSNNCALSGFLITNKGKLLIFSILANQYQTGATPIRKAEERFLEAIRKDY
jgi:D-alanyl-D-alanine carboxypeptidase/D-alanyl-D-alanine-endopeptidase (penicillin-binding protein 4)